jgi:hypothetical protein
MGWLVALPAMAVLYALNKRIKGKQKGRGKAVVALFTLAVAAVVGCGLAYTFLGRWFAGILRWGAGLLPGDVSAAIPVAVTVLVLLWASADVLYDRVADRGAQICAVMLPTLLYLVVGGALGAQGGDVVHQVNTEMAAWVRQLGGA